MATVEAELRAENERLRAERDEARRREAALSYVLGVMRDRPGDQELVLDAIVEQAATLTTSEYSNILLLRGDRLLSAGRPFILGRGAVPVAAPGDVTETYLRLDSAVGSALLERRTITVHGGADAIERLYPTSAAAMRSGLVPAGSAVMLPLLQAEGVLGVLSVRRASTDPYSAEMITPLEAFAAQAAIALQIAQAQEELEQRNRDLAESLEQQTATASVLAVIARSPEQLEPALYEICERAGRLLDAESSVLLLLDGDDAQMVVVRDKPQAILSPGWRQISPTGYVRTDLGGRSAWPGPGGWQSDVVRTGKVAHVWGRSAELHARFPDMILDPSAPGAARLAVPLLQGTERIGLLQTGRKTTTPFSNRQIALLQTFADQAVIAIENSRLFNELEQRNKDLAESLQQQTATSEILKTISRAPGDSSSALQAIIDASLELCHADGGRVWLIDGDDLVGGPIGGDSSGQERPSAGVRLRRSLVDHLRLEDEARARGAPVHLPDYWAYLEQRNDSNALAYARAYDQRTRLYVPLRQAETTLGLIALSRGGAVRPFSDAEIKLAESFGGQAVIAIDNARLFHQLEQRNRDLAESLEQQTAMAEVLRIISRSPAGGETALGAIVERARELLGAERAAIGTFDGDVFSYTLVFDPGLRPVMRTPSAPWERIGNHQLRASGPAAGLELLRTPAGVAHREARPVQVWGTPAEAQALFPDIDTSGMPGSFSRLVVPLLQEGRAIGTLLVNRFVGEPFLEKQISLLQTFADQAVIAVQNSRLFNELEQRTRQLEEANAAKSQFLSTMSHELRTPLNAVIGYSELLREEAEEEGLSGMVPDLVRINAAGKHLLSLINNVLDISKIEAGKMELELQDFAVSDVLAEVEAVVPPLMSRNGNRLVLDVAGHLGSAHTDKTKLRQCLLNLLSNGAKFTDRGTVTLLVHRTLLEAGDQLSFSVSDTGIGIPDEQLSKLFQSFTRAEAGTASRYGGTGLGLALSREFARLMGGDITVESEAGRGSTFRLTLPAEVKPPAPAAAPQPD